MVMVVNGGKKPTGCNPSASFGLAKIVRGQQTTMSIALPE
jgi:hypothetical protein